MLVTPLLVLERRTVCATDVFSAKHCSKGHCTTGPRSVASSYHPREQERGLRSNASMCTPVVDES